MTLHLVGARSYVLDSVRRVCEFRGIGTRSFGSVLTPDIDDYRKLPKKVRIGDVILVFATPGDFRSRGGTVEYKPNPLVLEFIGSNPQESVCLSTVRVGDHSNDQRPYAVSNLEFEKRAIDLGARVLRLPNYWGFNPTESSGQSNLAPWVFLRHQPDWPTFPSRKIAFVTPVDVVEKVGTPWTGISELKPSLELSPNDIHSLAEDAMDEVGVPRMSHSGVSFLDSAMEFGVYTLEEHMRKKSGPDVTHAR